MALMDTHTHLVDASFDDDREAVIARAVQRGIERILVVSETLDDAREVLRITADYPEVLEPALGLFPTVLDPEQGEAMEALIRHHREELTAIGEVGLDHWKVKEDADREIQAALFSRFIALSRELNLPLNVHSRSAGAATVEQLLKEGATRVQMHAFDGRAAKALPAVEAGYFFSIPPSIVRSRQKQKLVKRLPLSCLLLETDSPVLGPDPGSRNEPMNLTLSLATIAELKGLPEEEVRQVIQENQRRLYPKLDEPRGES